jgi:hypothetical protein
MDAEASDSEKKRSEISVMLTAFKRPKTLQRQINAINAQTMPVREIWLYHNNHKKFRLDGHTVPVDRIISTFPNLGVWPRFLACMDFETEYVCVFDDDTIPGTRWLENCYKSMQKTEGLYGTNGILFPKIGRGPRHSRGWKVCVDEITPVDIVGHSWFFKRDWLRYYSFFPRPDAGDDVPIRTAGEDYHFSYVLQKGLGLGTYVPPHPKGRPEWHGSTQGRLGRDHHALWKQKGEEGKKARVHEAYRKAGWTLVSEGGLDASKSQSEIHLPGSSANRLTEFVQAACPDKPAV